MEETRLFSSLIRFENHCSRELLESMKSLPKEEPHAFKLFGHVLESQLIWLARLAGESEMQEPWWPRVGYEGCLELLDRTERNWNDFLGTLSDERLGNVVNYRPLGGARARVVVRDILVHLFVHAAHLRGQISLELKDKGISPPLPNYLGFARQDGG